jgi:hypothetical protein
MINRINTGFNDKYAYGVVTRRVEMSRGNKQGNNAFTLDSYLSYPGKVHSSTIKWMMYDNHVSLKSIKQVQSYNIENRDEFLYGIHKAVFAGNVEKAEYFMAESLKRDESTFSIYHRLALIAKNVKELGDIQKRNVTK